MQRRLMLTLTLSLAFMAVLAWPGLAQDSQQSPSQQAPAPQSQNQPQTPGQAPRSRAGQHGGHEGGTVTSVGVGSFQIKKRDGSSMTVLVNGQTRVEEAQKQIQLEDLKPGDHVMIRGEMNDQNQFVASAVHRLTEQDMQRFMGDRTFGKITAINGNQLTVSNPRQGEKVVTVNDQTTFMKDGQPIALKDLKVGDRLMATGKEQDGQFVATRVMTGELLHGSPHGGPPQGPGGGDNPDDND